MEESQRLWTDIESKKQLRSDLLSSESVTVTFTKVDGSTRVMNCTLNFDYIPEELKPIIKEGVELIPIDYESDSCRVFDIDAQGWRSFRFSTITNVTLNKESIL